MFFDEVIPSDREVFVRVLPEDNHTLVLFMLYPEFTTDPLPSEQPLHQTHPNLIPQGHGFPTHGRNT